RLELVRAVPAWLAVEDCLMPWMAGIWLRFAGASETHPASCLCSGFARLFGRPHEESYARGTRIKNQRKSQKRLDQRQRKRRFRPLADQGCGAAPRDARAAAH